MIKQAVVYAAQTPKANRELTPARLIKLPTILLIVRTEVPSWRAIASSFAPVASSLITAVSTGDSSSVSVSARGWLCSQHFANSAIIAATIVRWRMITPPSGQPPDITGITAICPSTTTSSGGSRAVSRTSEPASAIRRRGWRR